MYISSLAIPLNVAFVAILKTRNKKLRLSIWDRRGFLFWGLAECVYSAIVWQCCYAASLHYDFGGGGAGFHYVEALGEGYRCTGFTGEGCDGLAFGVEYFDGETFGSGHDGEAFGTGDCDARCGDVGDA